MASITLKGNLINTVGELPAVGSAAPDFRLTKDDLSDVSLKDFAGKKIILNIFPSVDTPVCATSVRTFNKQASGADNTVVVCASHDLPFAFKRFCGAEGIENVVTGSVMRDNKFGDDYGVKIADGPLAGICSRAIVVIDENGVVKYTEQVPEITQEPNYDAAIAAL
jgi:thiol peroxidase